MPAINLQKHGAEMQKALKSVRDPKNSTDWALFGYDGKTFDLKVVETGEDGIEEMVNDLNASKILYGFMRVKDPKSGLPKYVFLHWQGEGCPVTLKGQASNLLRDVEKYIGSYQISITARNEDEVDIKEIMKQVEKASTSKFNFKARKEITKDRISTTDVKSVYQKVIISKAKELNMTERNKFWDSEEATKKAAKKVVVSKDEIPTKQQREGVWKQRENEQKKSQNTISKPQEKPSGSPARAKNIPEPTMSLKDRMKMLEESKPPQNLDVDKLNITTNTKTSPVPVIPTQQKTSPAPSAPISAKPTRDISRDASQDGFYDDDFAVECDSTSDVSTIPHEKTTPVPTIPSQQKTTPAPLAPISSKPTRISKEPSHEDFDDDEFEVSGEGGDEDIEDEDEDVYGNAEIFEDENDSDEQEEEDIYGNAEIFEEIQQDLGICAVTLYDYEAEDESEITFDPGEVITNIEKPDSNWWQGKTQEGQFGLFPANYVEEIDPSELQVS